MKEGRGVDVAASMVETVAVAVAVAVAMAVAVTLIVDTVTPDTSFFFL